MYMFMQPRSAGKCQDFCVVVFKSDFKKKKKVKGKDAGKWYMFAHFFKRQKILIYRGLSQ